MCGNSGYSDDVDHDSDVMPITYSEVMAIRSERSDAGFCILHYPASSRQASI
jgi:hypothetical protein